MKLVRLSLHQNTYPTLTSGDETREFGPSYQLLFVFLFNMIRRISLYEYFTAADEEEQISAIK